MTRNRSAAVGPEGDGRTWGSGIAVLLTLLLLAPAAALLAARARNLVAIERAGLPGCSGLQAFGPVLQAGIPVVILLLAVPAALLSIGHRARGWLWLLMALAATVLLEIGLDLWLPSCV